MSGQGNDSFWVSYSDLATGLMIVFMLVMLIMVILQKQDGEVQTERISEVTAKIEIILGQKSKLSDSINQAFKDDPSVRADPVTAQISIDEDALKFEESKAYLSPKGRSFVTRFTPSYICALWKHEYEKCVERNDNCYRLDPELPGGVRRIHVTGHADMKGTYPANHQLSAARSEEVIQQMLTALQKSNANIKNIEKLCQDNLTLLQGYAEERLWAIGAGETQHCTYELNNLGDVDRKSIQRCDALLRSEKKYRKVDFGLELTGDDMTGLLADVVALRKAVGSSKEGDSIDKLADSVAQACWKDPGKYHGCKIFARDCLAGATSKNCDLLFESKDLGVYNMIKDLCRTETLAKCP
jgi:hypothetical protein